jgi:putative ABC transport system substrate-binding protein
MNRRMFLASALAGGSLPGGLHAQPARKIARIGWLTAQQATSLTPYLDVVRAGFAQLGYVEGGNLVIAYRYGDDSIDRVPALAAELAQIPVDLMLVQGAAVAVVGKLGLKVPVVYVTSGDPVSAGWADSLARPRGNMTGLTFMAAEVNSKRLELLAEIIPGLRRVAVVANPEHPGQHLERANTEQTGRRLGLTVTHFTTSRHDELSAAFTAMAADPPQAISVFSDGFAIQNRQRIIDFAMRQRIPVISGWRIFARSGALCIYGPRLEESYRRLAYYADRILKGAQPADLPIEQPTHFELVVNLKTARALGVAIPQSILARADDVIE